MRAAVLQGLGQPLQIHAVPDLSSAAAEVVVSIGRCGICGSDLYIAEDPVFGGKTGDILGHDGPSPVLALMPASATTANNIPTNSRRHRFLTRGIIALRILEAA